MPNHRSILEQVAGDGREAAAAALPEFVVLFREAVAGLYKVAATKTELVAALDRVLDEAELWHQGAPSLFDDAGIAPGYIRHARASYHDLADMIEYRPPRGRNARSATDTPVDPEPEAPEANLGVSDD